MTTPHRYVSGAIDLADVKAQAEARQQPAGAIASFIEVTPENFEADVVRRSLQVPVIVMAGSSRSPESEQLKADLQALAAAGNLRFIVGYADADTHPEVAQAFGVQALPTVIALAGGRPLTQFEGAQPREVLDQWLTGLVNEVAPQLQGLDAAGAEEQPAEEDPRLDAAMEALNAGDFDAAIAVYEEILAEEPENKDIQQARNTTLLLKRMNPDDDPMAAAEADPADVDKQFAAADAEIVAGAPERAFDRLIGLLHTPEKDRVRARLIELLALFDAADPRVTAARTKMASALF